MDTAPEKLEDLADKWMTQVVAMSTILNNQIHESIRLGVNLDTRNVRGLTYVIIAAFGSYVVQQKVLSEIGLDKKEEFAKLMREKYLSIQKAITDGDHDEKWLATTKNAYDGPLKKLSSTKGPVANWLKEALALIFSGYTELEFVKDSFFNRLKPSSKVRISTKVLDELALSAWTSFMELEIDAESN
ncbi:MAG: hypothetical protein B7X04_03290 [Parcubacteria group bacterium 21-54-25]|nr:MAG: hypothetical protein B7X04_03290 [Parcubacteria group bacterium 21-54-25]HQU08045.1 hypothetical protein [Candidatus Paceibacterota bacterium]